MENLTGSKLGKEYVKAVYIVTLFIFNLSSCELLGWMNSKLQSRLLEEISVTSDMEMIPL